MHIEVHSHRLCHTLLGPHGGRERELKDKAAAAQTRAEGESAVNSSKQGKSSDKHAVNFALNSFVPCDLWLYGMVTLSYNIFETVFCL